MLYFFITKMSKQKHFFAAAALSGETCCDKKFPSSSRWDSYWPSAFPAKATVSIPLFEATTSYSVIALNLESDTQQSEGDTLSRYIKICSRISFYLSLFLASNEPLSWIIYSVSELINKHTDLTRKLLLFLARKEKKDRSRNMEFAQFQLQEKIGMLELLLWSLMWFRENICSKE